MAKAQRICSVDGCNKPHFGRGCCRMHYSRWQRNGDPLGGRRTCDGEPMKFIHGVALHYEGDECLIWPFSRNPKGRGQVTVGHKTRKAHRVVCELAHGAPPTPEHVAAHSCGKGHLGCVSPKHLRWATHAENVADMVAHGTHNGWGGLRAKISADDAEQIRALKGRMTQAEIGRQFGISQRQVSHIHANESWVS